MLARPTNLSENQAAHYYEQDDYYTHKEVSQFAAYWHGKGAKTLGLTGAIAPSDFQTLLSGYSPQGRCLHAKPIDSGNHRAGTDYTFNAPKTVSIAALVQGDDRLVLVHDQALQTALDVKESRYAQARVWNAERKCQVKVVTGNLISAVYRHETNRNQDPHLHSHDADLNATQVGVRWRAVANERAVENQKLLGQIYQNDCAFGARQLGYEIEPRPHGQFELKGYAPEAITAFSTRRQEIEAFIEQAGESQSVRAYQRAALQTRQRKTHLPRSQVHQQWQDTIDQHHLQLPEIPDCNGAIAPGKLVSAEQLVQASITVLVETQTAFTREQLEQHILETHLGQCPFRQLASAIDQSPNLVAIGLEFTTPEKLQRLQDLHTILGFETRAKDKIGQTSRTGQDIDPESSRRDDGGVADAERSRDAVGASTSDLERSLAAFTRPDWLSECNAPAVVRGVTAVRERRSLESLASQAGSFTDAIASAGEQFRAVAANLERAADELARRQVKQQQAEQKRQEELADQVFPIASMLFQQQADAGMAIEQSNNLWVVAWDHYAITLEQDNGAIVELLSIEGNDRGELVRSLVGTDGQQQLEVRAGLTAEDVTAFTLLQDQLLQWQQQLWVEQVAPIAAEALNLSGELELVGEDFTVRYQPQSHRLTVEDGEADPLLIAQRNGDRWLDAGSRLQEVDVNYFQTEILPQVQVIQQQQHQEWVATQTRIAMAYFNHQSKARRSQQNNAGEWEVTRGDYQLVLGQDQTGEYFALRATGRGDLVEQRPGQSAVEVGEGLTPEDGAAIEQMQHWLKQQQRDQLQI
ncbi:MAG: relaxase domain-containing protein [Leptolyngbyaceae cyanobacterium SM1_3_5]|nr:relaxase domain-containing protein [Leptolyngbyaceae cyanobacterium SM1_3_5]